MSRLKSMALHWQREGRITAEQRRRLGMILAASPKTASEKSDPEFALLMRLVDVAYGYLEENGLTKTVERGAESTVPGVPDVARLLQAQLSETNSVTETAALAIMGKLNEVHAEAGQLIATLGGIRNRATALRSDDETKWFASLGSALPRLSGDFQSVVGELEAFAGDTEKVVRTIRSAIVSALEHGQFQDISRQQLEQVSQGILLMADSSDRLEGISATDDIAGALASSYIMDSQRVIHRQTLGQSSASGPENGALPKIELF